MLEAAQLAASYVQGLDRAAFLADRRTQQAVLMNLVILGEAASKVIADHSAFLGTRPELPWRTLRALRNRVTHGYFETNLDLVWEMATVELPALAKQLPDVCAAADAWSAQQGLAAPGTEG